MAQFNRDLPNDTPEEVARIANAMKTLPFGVRTMSIAHADNVLDGRARFAAARRWLTDFSGAWPSPLKPGRNITEPPIHSPDDDCA